MKNIILQHFTGKLRPLDQLSIENISAYAKRIGVDYQFVEGQVFKEHLTPPCQKVICIDERYDDYDNVLMLDIDMFATKNLMNDVFNTPGIGLHVETQTTLRRKLSSLGRIKLLSAYWGGSFYKLDKPTRKAMRDQLPDDDQWMDLYNEPYYFEDEGIMAELFYKAGLSMSDIYIQRRWCQCSFLEQLQPGFIHVRTKITPKGPKREKIENYYDLTLRGII